MRFTVAIHKIGEIDVEANSSEEALLVAEQLDQQNLIGFYHDMLATPQQTTIKGET